MSPCGFIHELFFESGSAQTLESQTRAGTRDQNVGLRPSYFVHWGRQYQTSARSSEASLTHIELRREQAPATRERSFAKEARSKQVIEQHLLGSGLALEWLPEGTPADGIIRPPRGSEFRSSRVQAAADLERVCMLFSTPPGAPA
jgi:hypothetical protein